MSNPPLFPGSRADVLDDSSEVQQWTKDMKAFLATGSWPGLGKAHCQLVWLIHTKVFPNFISQQFVRDQGTLLGKQKGADQFLAKQVLRL